MSLSQIYKGTLVFLAALLTAYIVVLTLNVWVSVLIAILLASALRPAILWLMRWRIPQNIAVLIVYLIVASLTITLLVIILPPVVNEFVGYIRNDARLANRIISAQLWVQRTVTQLTGNEFELGITPEDIRTSIADAVDNLRVTAPSLVGNASGFLRDFILIIVMGLYWVTSREQTVEFLINLTPLKRREQVRTILNEVEIGLGSYVRGIVLVSIIVGVLCFGMLTILRVPGAGTISFIYAVTTAIPIIGGFVGVVLATFLALLASPINVVIVLVITLLIQQVENFYLTPRIIGMGAHFNPLLVIIFVGMGFSLGGIMGSLIAIPIAGTVSILLKHLILEPHQASLEVGSTRVDGGVLLVSSDEGDE